tara:strand:- start:1191 stop:1370 length:180 start_codon:yes stop_codon:yes gene_type:complete
VGNVNRKEIEKLELVCDNLAEYIHRDVELGRCAEFEDHALVKVRDLVDDVLFEIRSKSL